MRGGLTDRVVRSAQEVFRPVWDSTKGNDGYVSFELDPLLEDPANKISHAERVARYIELGLQVVEGARQSHDQSAGDARRAWARWKNCARRA